MTLQQNKFIEERIQKAIGFFENGYNCSQSVFMAYADLLKIKRQPEDATPSERNARYYALRPCSRCVAMAAEIVGTEIYCSKIEP